MTISIEQLKRQASILSKEVGRPHSECLNVASKLNGFKNYYHFQKTFKKEFTEEIKNDDFQSWTDISLRENAPFLFSEENGYKKSKYLKKITPLLKKKNHEMYEMQLYGLALVRKEISVEGDSYEDAIKNARKEIYDNENGILDNVESWECDWLFSGGGKSSGHGIKIVRSFRMGCPEEEMIGSEDLEFSLEEDC